MKDWANLNVIVKREIENSLQDNCKIQIKINKILNVDHKRVSMLNRINFIAELNR